MDPNETSQDEQPQESTSGVEQSTSEQTTSQSSDIGESTSETSQDEQPQESTPSVEQSTSEQTTSQSSDIGESTSETSAGSSEPQVVTPDNLNTSTSAEPASDAVVTSSDTNQAPVNNSVTSGNPTKKSGIKHLWRKVAIIAAIIIVLAGGSAAAFYTVYLPSQPWYVLDTALKNTLAETNFTVNSNGNVTSAAANGLSFKFTSLTAANFNTKQLEENLNLTIAGATIPVEARLVNSNLYLKFGNLSSLAPLAGLALGNASASSALGGILTELSNKWVVVDSTLLAQNKDLRCLMGESWTLSNSDSNYMVNTYLDQPFFTVQSSSTTTLNSQSEDRMVVSMNNAQAANYINDLSNLSAAKSYAQCVGSKTTVSSHLSASKNQTTPFVFWINKSTHMIDQIQTTSTAADAKNGTTGTIDASFSYGNVSVQAPANAVPFDQLLAQLMQSMQSNPQLLSIVGPSLSKL